MRRADRPLSEPVRWDGRSRAIEDIGALLTPVAPAGTLRIVLQRLALREQGRHRGEHEVIEAVSDVGGNLVVVPLWTAVRHDSSLATRLDGAVALLRHDLARDGYEGVDVLEVQVDADGARRVLLGFDVELTRDDVTTHPLPSAVHDGAHQIATDAPALDELRDRLLPPPPGRLRRLWDRLRDRVS